MTETRPYISPPGRDRKVDEPPSETTQADQVRDLVVRAQAGDRDAFAALYQRFHAPVWRLARFGAGPGEADDVVAETFVRAWRALPRYRDTGAPFASWLYGIARHVVADTHRRGGRVEPVAEVPDRATDPQHVDRLWLATAVRSLPEEQRRVIEMKFLAGLTNDEVASAMGRTTGAVNALQWRALRALRKEMEK